MRTRAWSAMACVLALLASLLGCAAKIVPTGYAVYGASLKMAPTESVSADQVFTDPAAYDGKQIRMTGTIDKVCANRGCWLALRRGERILRARFVESGECSKGFFVPRDAAGHKVILEGTVKQETITEADARHYLQDADAPAKEIDAIVGPQQALSMICTAVAIDDGKSLSEPFQPESQPEKK